MTICNHCGFDIDSKEHTECIMEYLNELQHEHFKRDKPISILTIYNMIDDGTIPEHLENIKNGGVLFTDSEIIYHNINISHEEFANVMVHMLNTISNELFKKCDVPDIVSRINMISSELSKRHLPKSEVRLVPKEGIVS
jgi:hypothetical protein